MRDPNTSTPSQGQAANQTLSASSPSLPRPYPVSIRAYKKKDYEYLSAFPRMGTAHSALRPSRSAAELLHARSDGESDLSMTETSSMYTTSISSASSTSSAQGYAKDNIALMDMESHHQRHLSDEHHHLSNAHASQIPMDHLDSHAEADLSLNGSHAEMMGIQNMGISGDLPPGPPEDGSVHLAASIRTQAKPKPRPINTPVVLPKFGSWDTKNPSSGEAYTLIFRRLRDEKKSGGLPISGSPTHLKTEGAVEICPPEDKAKASLCSNREAKKRSSRRKVTKDRSPPGMGYNRKRSLRWNLCCKASVLDD